MFPWLAAAYASLGLALVAVLWIAARGAYLDFEEARVSLLQAEINRLRSHAVRTVLRIQDLMVRETAAVDELEAAGELDWLREHWDRFIPQDESRLYAAIVDSQHTVVMHNRRTPERAVLPPETFLRAVVEAGDDVVETNDSQFTGGSPALDIAIPIVHRDREAGTYHSGFNLTWFNEKLAVKSAATRERWIVAFAVISLVIGAAGLSLLYIARRISKLQTDVTIGRVRRLAELGQLAGAIAHEVRNPLNAIRLNLHVVQRLAGRDSIDGRTAEAMSETVREIERIDELLRALLEYARPDRTNVESLDVVAELRSVVGFMQPLFDRDDVRLVCRLPDAPITAYSDRARFRQIMLNLTKNALEAVGRRGTVEIDVRAPVAPDSMIEIRVRDDGPGIAAEDASRIFEPFFTTKELGTGLGLTLVARFLQELGGSIAYGSAQPRGSLFVVRLPVDAPPTTSDFAASETAASVS